MRNQKIVLGTYIREFDQELLEATRKQASGEFC